MYESIRISSSFQEIKLPQSQQPIHFESPQPPKQQPELTQQINKALMKQFSDELSNSEMQLLEIMDLKKRMQTIQKQNISLEEQSKKEIQQLTEQIRILSDRNKQHESENTRLNGQLQTAKDATLKSVNELQAIRDQLAQLKIDKEKQFVEIKPSVDLTVHSELLEQVNQLQSKIKVLEGQLAESKVQSQNKVKEMVKQHQDKQSKMGEELEKTTKIVKSMEQQIEKFKKEIAQSKENLDKSKKTQKNLNKSVKDLTAQVTKLTGEKTKLQNSIKETLSMSQTFNFREVVQEKFKELASHGDRDLVAQRMDSIYLKFTEIIRKVYEAYRK